MMRCSPFVYRAPSTVEEAVAILAGEGEAQILAGGTDLVPNMKRRVQTPRTLVAVRRLEELRSLVADSKVVRLGSALTLDQIAAAPRLAPYGALVRAAEQVATPHIRNMGTLGGNLCLDTRCNYYDQSYEWRKAIDFCMKREGEVCWVAPGSPRCWAVSSTDLAPALIALGAEVVLASKRGQRTLSLSDLYLDDGIEYLAKQRDELLTEVRLGDPTGWRSTYWKLRRRDAFDFPVLSVAAAVKFDRAKVIDARCVFGAVGCCPVVVNSASLIGHALDDDRIDEFADLASRLAKPLDNTDFALGWRKRVARAYIAGALRELRGDDPKTLGLFARRLAALRPLG